MTPEIKAALERMHAKFVHDADWCGCKDCKQLVADVALITAHVDAGARAQRARAIEECAQAVERSRMSILARYGAADSFIERERADLAKEIRALLVPAHVKECARVHVERDGECVVVRVSLHPGIGVIMCRSFEQVREAIALLAPPTAGA